MEMKARTLWPDLVVFEQWVCRNCINCRWRYRRDPDRPDQETCSITAHCLIYIIKDQLVPRLAVETIFGPMRTPTVDECTTAPWMCNARVDKRGRPQKKPAF